MPSSKSQKRARDLTNAKAEISSLVQLSLSELANKRIRSIFGQSSASTEPVSNDECQAFIDQFVLHRLTLDETAALVRAGRQGIAAQLVERPVKRERDRLVRLGQLGATTHAGGFQPTLPVRPASTSRYSSAVDEKNGVTRGLIIREAPLESILAGRKTWEMRNGRVKIRGTIALIKKDSKAIFGVADIVDSRGPLSRDGMLASESHHGISASRLDQSDLVSYRHAWVFARVRRLAKPIPYEHNLGATRFTILNERAMMELASALRNL